MFYVSLVYLQYVTFMTKYYKLTEITTSITPNLKEKYIIVYENC